ncbi:MAG: MFS transporter [Thermoplasmata archaeon]|nr:MFS transporter [Thermoplasmata archaeon]MCI4337797.1 MFS transporter [Thermoplasmata archaeon]MCI4341225.1 MFS transporter [Thermoplasmata archaeon]
MRFLEELRAHPRFRFFLLAGTFSFAAPTAALVILSNEIVRSYASSGPGADFAALALAFLGLSATIPTLGAAVFSGTLADRMNRLRLMRLVTAVCLAALGAAAVVLYLRSSSLVAAPGKEGFALPVWLLLLFPLWAAMTAAATIFRPAFNASVPKLVPKASLGRANGLIFALTVAVGVVSWVAVGPITDTVGPVVALLVPIVLFAGSLACLSRLTADLEDRPTGSRRSFLSDASEGYRFLVQRRELLAITVGSLGINFLNAVAFVELPLYALDYLSGNAALLGAFYAVGSLGGGVGSLLIGRTHFERNAGRLIALMIVPMGVTVAVLPLLRSSPLALGDMFLFGLFPGMVQTMFLAGVQGTVPNRLLGRVFAADEVGSFGLVPAGQLVGGSVTIAFGLRSAFLLAGVGTVAIGVALMLVPAVARFRFSAEPVVPPAVGVLAGLPEQLPASPGINLGEEPPRSF